MVDVKEESVICCTTCEQPMTGNVLRRVVDVQLHSNPMPMEKFEELLAELSFLNAHQHQMAREP